MTQAQAFNEFAAQAFYADASSLQARQRVQQEQFVCVRRIVGTEVRTSYFNNINQWVVTFDALNYLSEGIVSPAPDTIYQAFWRVIITDPAYLVKTNTNAPAANWSEQFGNVTPDGRLYGIGSRSYPQSTLDPYTYTFQVQVGCPDADDYRWVNWPGSIATRTRW